MCIKLHENRYHCIFLTIHKRLQAAPTSLLPPPPKKKVAQTGCLWPIDWCGSCMALPKWPTAPDCCNGCRWLERRAFGLSPCKPLSPRSLRGCAVYEQGNKLPGKEGLLGAFLFDNVFVTMSLHAVEAGACTFLTGKMFDKWRVKC